MDLPLPRLRFRLGRLGSTRTGVFFFAMNLSVSDFSGLRLATLARAANEFPINFANRLDFPLPKNFQVASGG
jgi:hypothetical protein